MEREKQQKRLHVNVAKEEMESYLVTLQRKGNTANV
jgi:hypothetical protein